MYLFSFDCTLFVVFLFHLTISSFINKKVPFYLKWLQHTQPRWLYFEIENSVTLRRRTAGTDFFFFWIHGFTPGIWEVGAMALGLVLSWCDRRVCGVLASVEQPLSPSESNGTRWSPHLWLAAWKGHRDCFLYRKRVFFVHWSCRRPSCGGGGVTTAVPISYCPVWPPEAVLSEGCICNLLCIKRL